MREQDKSIDSCELNSKTVLPDSSEVTLKELQLPTAQVGESF